MLLKITVKEEGTVVLKQLGNWGGGIRRPVCARSLGFPGEAIYVFLPDERLINTKMPRMMRIIGHH